MRHRNRSTLLAAAVLCFSPAALHAAQIGSVAELSTLFHDVAGTVTVIDDDTFRVDNFIYDGGGPAVYFYLGIANTDQAIGLGTRIQPLLSGNIYDGTQGPLFFDLPAGNNFAFINAVSVWCDQFGVNFGSGSFFPIDGDLDGDNFVGITDLNIVLGSWNLTVPSDPSADARADINGDGFIGIADLNRVLYAWNTGAPPIDSGQFVPEPVGFALLGLAGLLLGRSRI